MEYYIDTKKRENMETDCLDSAPGCTVCQRGTLGKLLNCSVPQFPHMYKGDKTVLLFTELLLESNSKLLAINILKNEYNVYVR